MLGLNGQPITIKSITTQTQPVYDIKYSKKEAAEALGVNPDEVIIASGRPWNDYLSTLKLPID